MSIEFVNFIRNRVTSDEVSIITYDMSYQVNEKLCKRYGIDLEL